MSEISKRVLETDYELPENKPRLLGMAVLLAREVEALETERGALKAKLAEAGRDAEYWRAIVMASRR